jgi:hypothetical protein
MLKRKDWKKPALPERLIEVPFSGKLSNEFASATIMATLPSKALRPQDTGPRSLSSPWPCVLAFNELPSSG